MIQGSAGLVTDRVVPVFGRDVWLPGFELRAACRPHSGRLADPGSSPGWEGGRCWVICVKSAIMGHMRDRFLPATRWFTGRHAALTDVARWLGNPDAGHRALVVTGNAGSGKTALLGLLAALSDADQAPAVPRDGLPAGLTVSDGAITEAIYAGTMTTGQVRDRIAAAAGLRADTTGELIEWPPARRDTSALSVLIDALDEAADPPGLISGLLNPLISERPGALRLLLGTRPHLLTAKLLGKPETGHYQLVDLDSGTVRRPGQHPRLHPADPAIRGLPR